MVKDFFYRFVVIFLVVLSVSLLIASVAISPAYFASSGKIESTKAKLEKQREEPVPTIDQNALADIKDLNGKLDLVENAEKNKFEMSSKIINEIILHKMPNIKITKISYSNDSLSGKKININGLAPSREALLSFRLALENDPFFKKVDLPIANFIKGSNIQFYINLIPS